MMPMVRSVLSRHRLSVLAAAVPPAAWPQVVARVRAAVGAAVRLAAAGEFAPAGGVVQRGGAAAASVAAPQGAAPDAVPVAACAFPVVARLGVAGALAGAAVRRGVEAPLWAG